jgi:hypothetical protein
MRDHLREVTPVALQINGSTSTGVRQNVGSVQVLVRKLVLYCIDVGSCAGKLTIG